MEFIEWYNERPIYKNENIFVAMTDIYKGYEIGKANDKYKIFNIIDEYNYNNLDYQMQFED